MNIPIEISVHDSNHEACGTQCPFLDDGMCVLFDTNLDRAAMSASVFNTSGCYERCERCLNFDEGV